MQLKKITFTKTKFIGCPLKFTEQTTSVQMTIIGDGQKK